MNYKKEDLHRMFIAGLLNANLSIDELTQQLRRINNEDTVEKCIRAFIIDEEPIDDLPF